MQYLVSGDVEIQVTGLSGSTAVISGLYFDAPSAANAVSPIKLNGVHRG